MIKRATRNNSGNYSKDFVEECRQVSYREYEMYLRSGEFIRRDFIFNIAYKAGFNPMLYGMWHEYVVNIEGKYYVVWKHKINRVACNMF